MKPKRTAPRRVGSSDCSALGAYPWIKHVIEKDGAIRVVDGRWSGGFVRQDDLQECLVKRLLKIEVRDGMGFAVPNAKLTHGAQAPLRAANGSASDGAEDK